MFTRSIRSIQKIINLKELNRKISNQFISPFKSNEEESQKRSFLYSQVALALQKKNIKLSRSSLELLSDMHYTMLSNNINKIDNLIDEIHPMFTNEVQALAFHLFSKRQPKFKNIVFPETSIKYEDNDYEIPEEYLLTLYNQNTENEKELDSFIQKNLFKNLEENEIIISELPSNFNKDEFLKLIDEKVLHHELIFDYFKRPCFLKLRFLDSKIAKGQAEKYNHFYFNNVLLKTKTNKDGEHENGNLRTLVLSNLGPLIMPNDIYKLVLKFGLKVEYMLFPLDYQGNFNDFSVFGSSIVNKSIGKSSESVTKINQAESKENENKKISKSKQVTKGLNKKALLKEKINSNFLSLLSILHSLDKNNDQIKNSIKIFESLINNKNNLNEYSLSKYNIEIKKIIEVSKNLQMINQGNLSSNINKFALQNLNYLVLEQIKEATDTTNNFESLVQSEKELKKELLSLIVKRLKKTYNLINKELHLILSEIGKQGISNNLRITIRRDKENALGEEFDNEDLINTNAGLILKHQLYYIKKLRGITERERLSLFLNNVYLNKYTSIEDYINLLRILKFFGITITKNRINFLRFIHFGMMDHINNFNKNNIFNVIRKYLKQSKRIQKKPELPNPNQLLEKEELIIKNLAKAHHKYSKLFEYTPYQSEKDKAIQPLLDYNVSSNQTDNSKFRLDYLVEKNSIFNTNKYINTKIENLKFLRFKLNQISNKGYCILVFATSDDAKKFMNFSDLFFTKQNKINVFLKNNFRIEDLELEPLMQKVEKVAQNLDTVHEFRSAYEKYIKELPKIIGDYEKNLSEQQKSNEMFTKLFDSNKSFIELSRFPKSTIGRESEKKIKKLQEMFPNLNFNFLFLNQKYHQKQLESHKESIQEFKDLEFLKYASNSEENKNILLNNDEDSVDPKILNDKEEHNLNLMMSNSHQFEVISEPLNKEKPGRIEQLSNQQMIEEYLQAGIPSPFEREARGYFKETEKSELKTTLEKIKQKEEKIKELEDDISDLLATSSNPEKEYRNYIDKLEAQAIESIHSVENTSSTRRTELSSRSFGTYNPFQGRKPLSLLLYKYSESLNKTGEKKKEKIKLKDPSIDKLKKEIKTENIDELEKKNKKEKKQTETDANLVGKKEEAKLKATPKPLVIGQAEASIIDRRLESFYKEMEQEEDESEIKLNYFKNDETEKEEKEDQKPINKYSLEEFITELQKYYEKNKSDNQDAKEAKEPNEAKEENNINRIDKQEKIKSMPEYILPNLEEYFERHASPKMKKYSPLFEKNFQGSEYIETLAKLFAGKLKPSEFHKLDMMKPGKKYAKTMENKPFITDEDTKRFDEELNLLIMYQTGGKTIQEIGPLVFQKKGFPEIFQQMFTDSRKSLQEEVEEKLKKIVETQEFIELLFLLNKEIKFEYFFSPYPGHSLEDHVNSLQQIPNTSVEVAKISEGNFFIRQTTKKKYKYDIDEIVARLPSYSNKMITGRINEITREFIASNINTTSVNQFTNLMIKSYIESNQSNILNETEENEENEENQQSFTKLQEKSINSSLSKRDPKGIFPSDTNNNINNTNTNNNNKMTKFMLDEKFDYGRFRREMIEQLYAKKSKLELFPDLDDSNFINFTVNEKSISELTKKYYSAKMKNLDEMKKISHLPLDLINKINKKIDELQAKKEELVKGPTMEHKL